MVILIEILDFKPKLLRLNKNKLLDGDGFYRVAWGYLKPVGLVKKNFGESKI